MVVGPEGIEPPTFGFVERYPHVSPYHSVSVGVKNRQYSCGETHWWALRRGRIHGAGGPRQAIVEADEGE